MAPRSVLRLVCLAGVLAIVSGCAAGPAPRDHFYRLRAIPPEMDAGREGGSSSSRPEPTLAGTLEVQRLRSEGVTQERGLLYSMAGRPLELQRHEFHYWTEPPATMIQEQLASYFRAVNLSNRVVTPELRTDPDYTVSGRIDRIERVLGGDDPSVVLELQLALTRRSDNQVLWHHVYHAEEAAEGSSVSAAVEAFSRALAEVAGRFTADLGRLSQ